MRQEKVSSPFMATSDLQGRIAAKQRGKVCIGGGCSVVLVSFPMYLPDRRKRRSKRPILASLRTRESDCDQLTPLKFRLALDRQAHQQGLGQFRSWSSFPRNKINCSRKQHLIPPVREAMWPDPPAAVSKRWTPQGSPAIWQQLRRSPAVHFENCSAGETHGMTERSRIRSESPGCW